VRVTQEPGQGFLDRMIALVEGAERQKTQRDRADDPAGGPDIIFLIAVATVPAFARYAGGHIPVAVLAALLITLIPTTIAALLSAIGIAGMDRLVRFNVLAKSGRAVEAAGDVDVLLLDKTGTITIGDRQACAFRPLDGIAAATLAQAAMLASLADETPKAAPSSCSRARRSVSPSMPCPQARRSFPSPRRPDFGCRTDAGLVQKGAVDAILRANPEAASGSHAPTAAHSEEIARSGRRRSRWRGMASCWA
jgi:K+-transporting ATPase ATPase B chain